MELLDEAKRRIQATLVERRWVGGWVGACCVSRMAQVQCSWCRVVSAVRPPAVVDSKSVQLPPASHHRPPLRTHSS